MQEQTNKKEVFLGWSLPLSKRILEVTRQLLTEVFPDFPSRSCWSESDLVPGKEWFEGVVQQLRGASLGIFFATSENRERPWLYFEAGALAGQVDKDICVVAIDFDKASIPSPLERYQAIQISNREDVVKLAMVVLQKFGTPGDVKNLVKEAIDRRWKGFQEKIERLVGESKSLSKPEPPKLLDDPIRVIKVILEDLQSQVKQLTEAINSKQTPMIGPKGDTAHNATAPLDAAKSDAFLADFAALQKMANQGKPADPPNSSATSSESGK